MHLLRTYIALYVFVIPLLLSCKSKDRPSEPIVAAKTYETSTSDKAEATTSKSNQPYFDNGGYCANVTYYNKRTGTRSTYILNVEVSDGKLVKIKFPNGGWMDETHFTPPLLNEEGFASFINDKGYEYGVLIRHNETCTTDELKRITRK